MLAVVASLGYLSVGLVRGFSSPGVPSMKERDPYLLVAPGAVSWISSIPPLGACVGSLTAGPLLQRVGRRRTLLLSAPVAVAAWVALAAASSYPMLLGARIMTGFCAGLVIPSAQVYVSECARPSARGVLGSLPALFMSAGILLGYVAGAWLPWRWLAGLSAACPAALLALLLPLPESPAWLAARGRREQADAALRWLRRPPIADDPLDAEKAGAVRESAWSRDALLRRSVLLPLALALALMVFQQLSGIDAVIFYTVEIFAAAGGGVPAHAAAAIVGAVQLASNAVALFAVDRAGRRPLLLISGAVSAAAMAALGAYFYLHDQGKAEGLGSLPLVSLVVFMVGFSIGLCTLPYLMMAEMLPAAQRGALSSWAGAFNLGVMFIVIKTFHDLSSTLGEAGAFWVYSALCVASCVFVLLCVPETKGRSLEEIQAYFERRAYETRPNKKPDEEMTVGYQRDAEKDYCALATDSDKKRVKEKQELKLTHEKVPEPDLKDADIGNSAQNKEDHNRLKDSDENEKKNKNRENESCENIEKQKLESEELDEPKTVSRSNELELKQKRDIQERENSAKDNMRDEVDSSGKRNFPSEILVNDETTRI